MGKSKISIIIAREFSVRVKKRSFILTTILTPLFFAALMVAPGMIAVYSSDEQLQKVAVVDNSGIVMQHMESDGKVIFEKVEGVSADEFKKDFDNLGYSAVVDISPLDSLNNVSVSTYSHKQLNFDLQDRIARNVETAVEENKLMGYGIPHLEDILEDVECKINVKTYTLDEAGEEKASKVEILMGIGYVASFLIYMFIFLFGSMVMRSVIEEKTTRIIEVLVSSVKPFQIMMGKILGVASVALTQFLIWIVIAFSVVALAGPALGLDGAVPAMAAGQADIPVDQIAAAVAGDGDGFLQALKEVDYVQILGCFIVYFVLGYLLYSSMFAAVGAAVDNEADTQQLVLPVTMPLIVGLFIMLHTFQYPDSSLSFWGSMIPFTSPMVMMARIAYGVPAWELALSIAVLAVTFVAMAYLSGKIYRVGILMYGKKPGWKEIWKWLKY